jgi:hypothetical protein
VRLKLIRCVAAAVVLGPLLFAAVPAPPRMHPALPPRAPEAMRLVTTGRTDSQPSCPSGDAACYTISKGHPATSTWCISRSGNCATGLSGKQRWSADAYDCSTGTCVRTYKVRAMWDPKKGNPSIETISTRLKKPTVGYTYQVVFEACPVRSSPSDPSCIEGTEGVEIAQP